MQKLILILITFLYSSLAIGKEGNEDPINSNSPVKPKIYSKNRAFSVSSESPFFTGL